MDLIYQLEALNPTPDATNVNTIGDSNLCLTALHRVRKKSSFDVIAQKRDIVESRIPTSVSGCIGDLS